MKDKKQILNDLLVEIFNDILAIEELWLKDDFNNKLTITEVHTIEKIEKSKVKTMTEVAKSLSITVGTLTTAVKKLEKKGLIERKKDPYDNRVVLLNLTREGKKIFRKHEFFHKKMIDSIVDEISNYEEEKMDILLDSLSKLTKFFKDSYVYLLKKQKK